MDEKVIRLDDVRRKNAATDSRSITTFEDLETELNIASRSVSFFGVSASSETRAEDTVSIIISEVSEKYSIAFASLHMTREQWEKLKDMGDRLLGETDNIQEKYGTEK